MQESTRLLWILCDTVTNIQYFFLDYLVYVGLTQARPNKYIYHLYKYAAFKMVMC